VNRRAFLKIMLGTMPSTTVFGSLSFAGWPDDKSNRPVQDSIAIRIDDSGYLYDPDYGADTMSRASYFGIAGMDERERYAFYLNHFGEDAIKGFLLEDGVSLQLPDISYARFEDIEACLTGYFNEEIDLEQGSFRDQIENSSYWIGAWLFDNLPGNIVRLLQLTYVERDHTGSSFSAVRYTGEVDVINAVMRSNGLNAFCAGDDNRP
jgi:hypothetical protein